MKKEIFAGVSVLLIAIGAVSYGMLHGPAKKSDVLSVQDSKVAQTSVPDTVAVPTPAPTNAPSLQVGNGQGLGDIMPSNNENLSNGGTVQNNNPGKENFSQYDQYKDGREGMFGDIKVGTGAEVGINKQVAIYYKGYLTNGQLFDESKSEQANGPLKPFVFTEGKHEVISGMEQAIFGMKVGGKRRLVIPPAVGYGEQGQGAIPPNAVLVFDIDLVSVQ
jgi:hypothetical protein